MASSVDHQPALGNAEANGLRAGTLRSAPDLWQLADNAADVSYEQAIAILEQIAHLGHAVDPQRRISALPSTAMDSRNRAAGESIQRVSAAELRYRALIEKVPAVTFMAALDSNIQELYISPQIQTLLGFSQEEWLADPFLWYRQLHPDDRIAWGAEFSRTCATGVSFRSEYRLLARDGHTVWVHGECQIITDERGRPQFLLGIAFDITERKKAEQQLQESNRDLLQAIGSERKAHEALKHAQVALTEMNQSLERRVLERTVELEAAHAKLVDVARQAGVAEVVSGVLHNVGNVLNSVNVSLRVATMKLKQSPIDHLCNAIRLMSEHKDDLGSYLGGDNRGRHIPDFLAAVAEVLPNQQKQILDEINSLTTNIDHIQQIINVQQSNARAAALVENVDIIDLLEQAIKVNSADPDWNQISIVRDYAPTSALTTDKHVVLQILINLLGNARHAIMHNGPAEKRLIIRTAIESRDNLDWMRIEVTDNGIGIEPSNITRIFNYGFTTKNEGHGFGLHSSANGAKNLSGSLTTRSDGPGKGATFTLELPLGKKVLCDEKHA